MINETYIDDWYFAKKYKKYNITSRSQWFKWKTNIEKGEVYNLIDNSEKDHISKTKGNGSSDVTPNKRPEYERIIKEQPRFDLEDLHKFDYNILFDYQQNKKFNRLYTLTFNHDFFNDRQNEKYNEYVEIYEEDLENGNLEKINNICQRISTYIYRNDITNNKYIGGSVICNIALIISHYIKTGEKKTNIEFICEMSIDEMNETYNSYMLFLLSQIFTAKYKYVTQYINGEKIKENWRINHLRHRMSDKDMKTKGICPVYTMLSNGDINYQKY